jgi:2-keto-4-pentenoate hydratase/2-oxohepta-3-ene-1,7-dioic acid hydratase in catechol pathway
MTRLVRYTLSPDLPVTANDQHPAVRRGTMEEFEALAGARLLPAAAPSKIVCVGRNYVDHAKELGNPVPVEPIIFLKPPSSLNAPGGAIVYPAISELVSFEGELGVVIGQRIRRAASEAEAMDAVLGYTVVNDVTARDLQKKDGQWTRGKGFDTFCPVGPCVVPKAEVDLPSLRVKTRVNGETKQDAPIADMIFGVGAIIVFVSRFMTLEPGDLIATGTPPGVGPLAPGDSVEIEIPGIGVLSNAVTAE